MSDSFSIAGRAIGGGAPCFVIAEAGVNHNGEIEKALALVDVAAASGADAVKFQTFSAERLASADAPKARYQMAGTPAAESQLEMLRRLAIDEATHRMLISRAAERGILFLSSPFDEEAADLLEQLDVAAFKIPSGELINHPLLAHVAQKRRPMIVSTGMATLAEVEEAVSVIRRSGSPSFALLHCVSAYPATPADANLRAMATLADTCRVPVGWSDHMDSTEIVLAAVTLGAQIIEKHLTLDRSLPGPDHAASLEPQPFAAMVDAIRAIESALGTGEKRPVAAELEIAAVARKSIVTARPIKAGAIIERGDLTLRRPGTGIAPALLDQLIGRRTRAALPAGFLLSLDTLE